MEVETDVKETKKLTREDVQDLLKMFKSRKEAIIGIKKTLEGYKLLNRISIDRVISDVDSYGIEWEEDEI